MPKSKEQNIYRNITFIFEIATRYLFVKQTVKMERKEQTKCNLGDIVVKGVRGHQICACR